MKDLVRDLRAAAEEISIRPHGFSLSTYRKILLHLSDLSKVFTQMYETGLAREQCFQFNTQVAQVLLLTKRAYQYNTTALNSEVKVTLLRLTTQIQKFFV